MTCRSSARRAAWVYSFIRPPSTGFRRILSLSTSVMVARGASRSSPGNAGRCPGAVGPYCSAPGIRSGRHADVVRPRSARDPGAPSAKGADQAFADRVHARHPDGAAQDSGAGGLETASNEAVKFDPRSRITNLILLEPLVKGEGEVPGLLHGPLAARVGGDAAEMHPAGAVLDEYQGVRYPSAARCPRAGSRPRGSRRPGVHELPARSGLTGTALDRCPRHADLHTVDGATAMPSFVSSP